MKKLSTERWKTRLPRSLVSQQTSLFIPIYDKDSTFWSEFGRSSQHGEIDNPQIDADDIRQLSHLWVTDLRALGPKQDAPLEMAKELFLWGLD